MERWEVSRKQWRGYEWKRVEAVERMWRVEVHTGHKNN